MEKQMKKAAKDVEIDAKSSLKLIGNIFGSFSSDLTEFSKF
jgi:hypothetical protein